MPLLSVYNNFIHGYLMTKQTRFDTHNRRELDEIHSRIRKINIEQPLYKIDFNEEAQEYTLTVKEQAMDLAASLKELKEKEADSVFSRKTVVSDRPNTVGIEYMYGNPSEEIRDSQVEVRSLASTQINEGRLVASRETGVSGGQYTFTVEIEDSMYSFQFNVSEGSTNRELQTKLSDFINKAKVGLRSRVVSDFVRSRIEVESLREGTSFRFKDVKKPITAEEGIVSLFGMNEVSKEAAVTKVVIDGNEITSKDREYVTDDGVKYTFFKITEDEPVLIHSVTDDSQVMGKLEEFVDKYNNLADYVREGGETRRASKKLYLEMNGFVARHMDDFEEKGFMLDSEGRVSIDREKMVAAIRNGSMESMFAETSDITQGLLKKLHNISLNPIDYIDKTIVVYNNFNAKKQYNPYITSVYSGIMYNNYC